MKNTILLWALSLLISGALTAQKSKANKEIVINGSFLEPDGCGLQTISLWSWNGAMPEELLRSPVGVKDGKSTFSFTLPAGKKGIYYLGNDPQQLSVLVLNGEDKITLGGSCKMLNQISPSNSVANVQYNKLLETQQAHFQEFIQYINQYRGAMGNATAMAQIDAQMASLDKKRLNLLDSLKAKNPFLAKVAGISTYLSYPNNKKTPTQPEGEYFAQNFFKYADFADTSLWQIPTLFENIKTYASNIPKVGISQADQQKYMDELLSRLGAGTGNHRTVLFGFAIGSMDIPEAETNFMRYAKAYVASYPNFNQQMSGFLQERINSMTGVVIGELAPEIADLTPEGDTLKLSDLRGKVVLIDFWASWCGPCRKANPHLVEVYAKYKDKGFEILGVSLDRSKDAWIKAIATDNLTWKHLSDLQQWSSKWSRLYKVNSIPSAFLIGPDGKVIAKQVNPYTLDAELKRIFGE